jgi:hypothetical protein
MTATVRETLITRESVQAITKETFRAKVTKIEVNLTLSSNLNSPSINRTLTIEMTIKTVDKLTIDIQMIIPAVILEF